MRAPRAAREGLRALLIFALIFLGGCTTMRKTLDAIIESREEGRGGGAALAAEARPPGKPDGGHPWAY